MPATRRALEAGDVSLSAARVLVAARGANPEAFDLSEDQLVDAARIHTINDLQRVASFWRQRVERDHLDEGLRARRRLYASVSFEGMVCVDGDLDPEAGETLLPALRAVMDAGSRNGSDDDRTPPQCRADALHEICRQWLNLADRPTVAGERPHVTVTVDVPALAGASSGAGDLDHVGAVDVTVARQLSCDASVMRVVMAGRSQPLDVGRRTPIVPPAVRRAVILRDRVCRFPGCDRPHTWCDAHHAVHWADAGSTSLQNLVLLCRRHHRMLHRRDGFRLNLQDGVPIFRRRDGTVLEDRARRSASLADASLEDGFLRRNDGTKARAGDRASRRPRSRPREDRRASS